MLGGIGIALLGVIVSLFIIEIVKKKHPRLDASLLRLLCFYHFAISVVYYVYALFNPSDSNFYYQKVEMGYRGQSWFDFYGTSTTFIEFIGYPFVHFFGFSYEATMALFSFLGFIGFIYFFIFFTENLRFKHSLMGFD